MTKILAYYRVSTEKQGKSGLGLEGQRFAVEAFAKQTGAEILKAYTEIETGKRSDRPELAKALAHAKRSNATLVVGKLDRLSRNVAFTSALMDSGVDFVACDNVHANRLTLHILAAVAEDEVRRISERTKAALQAAKARGVKLGSARPRHWEGRQQARLNGLKAAREVSAQVRKQEASQAYTDIYPVVSELRAKGLTLQAIADELNNQGHTTRRGKPWNPMQVARVLERLEGHANTSGK